MSQDNQNSQPPSSPEPEAHQSEQTADQVTQPPQKPYQKVQPFWKTKIIQLLRGTIGLLETTVVKLETETSPGTKVTPSFLQTSVTASLRWWSTALAKIRFLLPDSVSAKLSDTALTGVIAGIVVILLWTTSSIFALKSTEVANVPPQQVESPVTITTPTESVPQEVPPVAETTPPPVAETTPPPVAETTPPPVAETIPPPVAETTPPPVAETTPPLPEPEPIPTPTPTPTIVLTPEQSLIAAIENQVAEVSDRFASGLIQSIQANFRTSSLTIKISDDWFNIKQSQQEKLATEMLQRSKELDFSHLDIIDTQGRLVARNPVVGTEIIIFQRRAT